MVQLTFMLLAAMLCLLSLCTEVLDTQVIGNSLSSCPSDERREAAKIDARNVINDFLLVPKCGEGVWHQEGFLNMNNSEQSSPPLGLRMAIHRYPICRSHADEGGCDAVLFPVTGRSHTRICGRATDYDIGTRCIWISYIRAYH